MTSAQIRQSFLDFFREKQHTIVPSSSLLPDAPNLLFTNAGMNQFVPIFLGQQKPQWNPPRVADTQKCIRAGGKHNDLEDVGLDTYHHTFFEMLGNWSFGDYFKKEAIEWAWELVVRRWGFPAQRLYATVYKPGPNEPSEFDQEAHDHWARLFRDADLDPSLHIVDGNKKDNFWMMGDTGPCGPCSELHVDLTPDGDTRGALVNKDDPRCIEIWNLVFIQFNADTDGKFTPLPQRHVDTGMGFERATAIIQGTKNFTDFSGTISNYETDVFRPIFDELEKLSGRNYGSTTPLKAPETLEEFLELPPPLLGKAIDCLDDREKKIFFSRLGLDGGTPRTLSSMANTFGVSDERMARIEEDMRKRVWASYAVQQNLDIAFRVIADHIRTLSFSIADGIIPSNEGRGYVLRRILRRAVRYGRTLNFRETFFYKLVDVVGETMGDIFPDVRKNRSRIKETIEREEESFNRTLDKGIELFRQIIEMKTRGKEAAKIVSKLGTTRNLETDDARYNALVKLRVETTTSDLTQLVEISGPNEASFLKEAARILFKNRLLPIGAHENLTDDEVRNLVDAAGTLKADEDVFPGAAAFLVYDTYGFPLDLTQLMAREHGLTVDVAGFERLMEEQRVRARKAQRKEVVGMAGDFPATEFVGYDRLSIRTQWLASEGDAQRNYFAIVQQSPLYAEMGGQVGDQGRIVREDKTYFEVVDTIKRGATFFLKLGNEHARSSVRPVSIAPPFVAIGGESVELFVDENRRQAIERHHTVTHILHWALHELVSREAVQKGSYVGPEKLTFDFSSAALTKQQVRDLEKLVNDKVGENALVSWTEIPYAEAKKRSDIQQFFGDKYGDVVRVVQIGGSPNELNGYSMELCGGTHVRTTGQIKAFRIVHEEAIAAGIRRIEAVAGTAAKEWAINEAKRQQEKFEGLRKKKSDISTLPAFSETHETRAMFDQIDARAAYLEKLETEVRDWEKQNAKASEANVRSRAAAIAKELADSHAGKESLVAPIADGDGKLLQAIADALKGNFSGPIFLAGAANGTVSLIAAVPPELATKIQANKLIQEVAPIVGGKGGGRPENARGAGNNPAKIEEALQKARELIAESL